MPPLVSVERTDTHKSVHPFFGFQEPVSVGSGQRERHALDACLVACLIVLHAYRVPFALRVTAVHTVQHFRPVLRFRAARSRVQRQYRVQRIVFPVEQRVEEQRFGFLLKLRKQRRYLRGGALLVHLLRHFHKLGDILCLSAQRADFAQFAFVLSYAHIDGFGFVEVEPEALFLLLRT